MIKKLDKFIADMYIYKCIDCPYLSERYNARAMDNQYKCKALKYKKIDCNPLDAQATFCPYKKEV